MPLPFDPRCLLPEGIHDASMEEIEKGLALSNRRRTLFENLRRYVGLVKMTDWGCQVLVDGSFVMQCVNEPDDIDVILVLPTNWDMQRTDFKLYEYNILDKKHTKPAFRIEVYPVVEGSERFAYFFDLFSRIRLEWCQQFGWALDSRKGIVRVTL